MITVYQQFNCTCSCNNEVKITLITADHCTWHPHSVVIKHYSSEVMIVMSQIVLQCCLILSHMWSQCTALCGILRNKRTHVLTVLQSKSSWSWVYTLVLSIIYELMYTPVLGYPVVIRLSGRYTGTTADYTARLPQLPRNKHKVDITKYACRHLQT